MLPNYLAQVLGPHGEYMMQHVRDVRSFWADKKDMAFGATYKLGGQNGRSSHGDGNGNGSREEDGAPREIIGEVRPYLTIAVVLRNTSLRKVFIGIRTFNTATGEDLKILY